jgi:glycosyltransferase involved in cell wall biosynthesis
VMAGVDSKAPGQTMDLSVIIITKNEATHIEACLQSVAFADEIIVVDSGSTDATVEICRHYTDHVVVTDWPGYGPQKNRALALSQGKWVLSIDADEVVTAPLRAEILQVIRQPSNKFSGYRMPRASRYVGQVMRHGKWWPAYVIRLVQRGQARFSDALVHESLIVNGRIGTLRGHLDHHSFPDFEAVLDRIDRYSTAAAQMWHVDGKRSSLSMAIFHGLVTFFDMYVLRCGFLDGRRGFMAAVSNAEGMYYRYLKLMLLSKGN